MANARMSIAELLQRLVQFDTTNPPGNEGECIAFVKGLMDEAGLETTVLAKDPNRPNLIARLPGAGSAPPLLLQGHVDVVPTANQNWTHPPFSGEIVDGQIWGRGTLDMKGGVAMMIDALLRTAEEGKTLPGDVILAVLADEERSGVYGARFLVEEHAELFDGVKYSIGEFGGFTFYLGGRKFYPIQIAEKQGCGVVARVHGPGGHASMPLRGGAMGKLGQFLTALDKRQAPIHITQAARLMIEGMAAGMPAPLNALAGQLLDPAAARGILAMLGPQAARFEPLLTNTASPTIVRGGSALNVHPGMIEVNIDGRLLPGFTPDQFLAELREAVGDEPELEVAAYEPFVLAPDMTLYDKLAAILKEADPTGIPIPYMLSAVTDARHFAKLGIQNYGFTPFQLPEGEDVFATVHAADEHMPVAGLEFGANAMYALLQRMG